MGKVFLNKQFSNYLGENRAILDTVVSYVSGGTIPTPTPSSTPSPTATPTPTPTPLPVFETEYQAILNRGTQLGFTLPSTAEKIKQNQLVLDLKNAGLWSKLGMLYMFKLDTSTGTSPGFTFINWITPSNPISSLDIYAGGSYPTHTTNSGWTFSQNNFIRLGINVGNTSVNFVNLTTSGNSEGLYYVDYIGPSSSGTNNMWSTDNNSWNRARYNNTVEQNIFRGINLTTTYDFTGLGFKTASINGRPDTDTTVVFRNGGVSTNRTKAGVDTIAIGSGTMRLNGSTSTQTHSWTCGMWYSAGGGFYSSVEVPAFETIINSYMTS